MHSCLNLDTDINSNYDKKYQINFLALLNK